MDKKAYKRMHNILYRLRKKGGVCVTKERTIYLPYGADPDALLQVRQLRSEFKFVVQYRFGET